MHNQCNGQSSAYFSYFKALRFKSIKSLHSLLQFVGKRKREENGRRKIVGREIIASSGSHVKNYSALDSIILLTHHMGFYYYFPCFILKKGKKNVKRKKAKVEMRHCQWKVEINVLNESIFRREKTA